MQMVGRLSFPNPNKAWKPKNQKKTKTYESAETTYSHYEQNPVNQIKRLHLKQASALS
jgi:hypothetical protein